MRIGVVGAGPAGMTFAGRVLKKAPGAVLNIFDRRTQPFGLVRYGIAPDHPEVRSCMRLFEETLKSPQVHFFGGVMVGEAPLTIDALLGMHDAVVLCTGMSAPRKLGIAGEDVLNAFTSAQIVGWYNGDPEHADIKPHLANVRRVAIIGHGNVALDVARVFLKPWQAFENSTISSVALHALSHSGIRHVDIIGRRGPLQMSFTIAELREMFNLPDVKFEPCQADYVLTELERFRNVWQDHRPSHRLFSMLADRYKASSGHIFHPSARTWSLLFKRHPSAVVGDETVDGLTLVDCELNYPPAVDSITELRAVREKCYYSHTSQFVPYDMVVSCIGYKPVSTFGLPVDDLGMIELDESAQHVRGYSRLYVGGWAATGARGHLADTFRMARELADSVISRTTASSALLPLPPCIKR